MKIEASLTALTRSHAGTRRSSGLTRWALSLGALVAASALGFATAATADDSAANVEFFEMKIRPVLIEHCYECHSAESQELQGELRLDLKSGWQLGGESGEPAIVPGSPDESPLIRAVRHDEGVSAMPPNQAPRKPPV